MKKIWQINDKNSLWLNLNGLNLGYEFDALNNLTKITVPFLCLFIRHEPFSDQNFSDNELRLFLLDLIDKEKREEINIWMRGTTSSTARLELIEDRIIEDYLNGDLPSGQRMIVENLFLITPERREKKRITELLHVFARPAGKRKSKLLKH